MNERQHIGAWVVCPGCAVGTSLNAIGSELFAVGHFNCDACHARWTVCPNLGCSVLGPDCPDCADQNGWVPFKIVGDDYRG